jgi:hypothetical protein
LDQLATADVENALGLHGGSIHDDGAWEEDESASQRVSESASQRVSESASQRVSESASQRVSE